MTGTDDLVIDVVRALAAFEGVEPHELPYSLHNHVATDAIRSLADSDDDRWELTFDVPDHVVTVNGSGEIRIDGDLVRRSDALRSERYQ
jgi:hypothetical protein